MNDLPVLADRYSDRELTPEEEAAWDAHIAAQVKAFRDARPELTPSWVLPRATASTGRAGHDSNRAE